MPLAPNWITERFAQRCLSLPMFPELTDEQLQAVATALRAALP